MKLALWFSNINETNFYVSRTFIIATNVAIAQGHYGDLGNAFVGLWEGVHYKSIILPCNTKETHTHSTRN